MLKWSSKSGCRDIVILFSVVVVRINKFLECKKWEKKIIIILKVILLFFLNVIYKIYFIGFIGI